MVIGGRMLYCCQHGRAEPQAPLACHSPGVSSQGTPRGYHTPISEEEPPRSFLQAPTPCSAILTVSLDGYLEPQRMSFSSPPASELNPRSAAILLLSCATPLRFSSTKPRAAPDCLIIQLAISIICTPKQ